MTRYAKPTALSRLPESRGVIEASAGTGKTYTLERLVVDLLLKGLKLEQILVVTFTDKATLEIKTRVRGMLEKLLDPVARAKDPAPAPEAPAWDLTPEALETLTTALRSFDRAAISTIHGFCRQVLQDSAFEGGSLFRQELADGRTLFGRAFKELLRTDFAREPQLAFLREISEDEGWTFEDLEQLLWSAHDDEGRLVPDPEVFLRHLDAFPPHLFGQAEAIIQGFETVPHKVVAGQTRAAAARKLPAFLSLIASRPPLRQFIQAWDCEQLTKSCLAVASGPAQELGLWLKEAHPLLPTLESIIVHTLLEPLRLRLQTLKAEEGVFDFKDMVHRVRDAVMAGAQSEALVQRLGARFKVALIDEFQDTDAAQWDIFRRVFLEQGLQLYVIGDPKQAIYGFRGGDLATYHEARKAILGRELPVVLEENHRSTPQVIEAYNHLLTHPEPVAFFHEDNRYPVPVSCGKKDLAFQAADGTPLKPVRIVDVPHEPKSRVYRAIAHTLALELKELIEGGTYLGPSGELEKPELRASMRLGYRHVQVLVAKKKEGLMLAEALREVGVPYAFYKQEGLFQTEEAMDLLDVLRAIEQPRDRGCLARALVTPFFGYGVEALEALPDLGEDHPVRERLEAWQELARARAFPQLLDQLLHGSGLVARLRLARQGDRALTNYLHLAELLMATSRERTRDLEDLIRLLGQWKEGTALPPGENTSVQRLEAEPDAVQILTMHQSKGLEAPIVAIFGFTGPNNTANVFRFHKDGQRCLWIGAKKGPRQEEIQYEENREAERLLYVALTRAKALLLLPCIRFDSKTKEHPEGKAVHTKGVYRALNPVLRAVLDGKEAPELFEVVGLRRNPADRPEPVPTPDLSGWAPPPVPQGPGLDYEALRRAARPVLTTSYTHLSAWAKQHGASAGTFERHGEQDQKGVPLPSGDLPGGPRTGDMMHGLLEELELEGIRGVPFETWWTPSRESWATHVLRRYGLDPIHAETAVRRAFQAVQAPLPGRDGSAAPLLAHDPGCLAREMDFLSGYFDTQDYLTGAMDAVFQRDGLTYVLDWKNDLLASYGPAALEAHVRHRYAIQVQVYTWIVLRWLRIETEAEYEAKFGGVHYVFLRGMPEAGVWFHRPTWAEVVVWKDNLMRLHGELTHA